MQTSQKARGGTLKYAEMDSIEVGLKFKTVSGIMVETTGVTTQVESNELYVHEVLITEGVGEGEKYLYNLDSGELLDSH
jgi:hypothetical protein